jgi:TetR/AcrR family transcriptional regulator, mexJK operon transcriptional repressor
MMRDDKSMATGAGRARQRNERRDDILAAATEVFLGNSYESASIDDVVARVGCSKRTVYAQFGNKEGLFAAVVRSLSDRAVVALPDKAGADNDPAVLLEAFGVAILSIIMQDEIVRLWRAMLGSGNRFPNIAQIFYENGPDRARRQLASVLRQLSSAGCLSLADVDAASAHFMGMLRDDAHVRVLLGLRPSASPKEIRASAQLATRLFLDGCRAGSKPT